jgi:hypothetical protein
MKTIVYAIIVCAFIGCGGVSFEALRLSNDLPESFKQRNLYLDESGTVKYKLTELVGRVIYQDSSAHRNDTKTVILAKDYVPALEVIKDADGQIFEGLVNKEASAKGSYLAFAGSLSSKQVASVTIADRNIVYVNNKDIPWAMLLDEAKLSAPKPSIRRLWIQGALLSSIDITKLDSIGSNASGVVGPTLGVEGKVYNKKSESIHDYRVSVLAVDLDKLAELNNVKHLLPITEILKDPEVLKKLYATGVELISTQEPGKK